METIKNFLEGKISKDEFFETLYNSSEMEEMLNKENDIPPYTNNSSLYHYLVLGNKGSVEFIIDAKDSLERFLLKQGITVNLNDRESEIQDILLSSLPKWLDVDISFFEDVFKLYNGKNKKEIKDSIKKKIEEKFIFLKTKPKWLQAPNWPVKNGEPLIFIGEKDISSILHDVSKVYIFYSKTDDDFTCIRQSM